MKLCNLIICGLAVALVVTLFQRPKYSSEVFDSLIPAPVHVGDTLRVTETRPVTLRNKVPVLVRWGSETFGYGQGSVYYGQMTVVRHADTASYGDVRYLYADRGLKHPPYEMVDTKVTVLGEGKGKVLLQLVADTLSVRRYSDWFDYASTKPCPLGAMFLVEREYYNRLYQGEQRIRREERTRNDKYLAEQRRTQQQAEEVIRSKQQAEVQDSTALAEILQVQR